MGAAPGVIDGANRQRICKPEKKKQKPRKDATEETIVTGGPPLVSQIATPCFLNATAELSVSRVDPSSMPTSSWARANRYFLTRGH